MTDLLPCICGSDNVACEAYPTLYIYRGCCKDCGRKTPDFERAVHGDKAAEYAAIWWDADSTLDGYSGEGLTTWTKQAIHVANLKQRHPVNHKKPLMDTFLLTEEEANAVEKGIRLCMKINHPDCGWPDGLED